MNITPREEAVPLTPQAFHVLLALAEKPMYGYGIFEQCQTDANGDVNFDLGSIYRTITRLSRMGLVKYTYETYSKGSHHPRKYLTLTNTGQTVLEFECNRYREMAHLGHHRLTKLRKNNQEKITSL